MFSNAPGATPAFGAKPATTGLTFGAPTSAAGPTFGGFGQQSSSLFPGATASTAAKPGLFGTGAFGTPSFSGTTGFGATPALGTGLGTNTTGMNFGTSTGGTGLSLGTGQPLAPTSAPSQLPAHQYILALSELSQTSDHPLFRKMLEPSGTYFRNVCVYLLLKHSYLFRKERGVN